MYVNLPNTCQKNIRRNHGRTVTSLEDTCSILEVIPTHTGVLLHTRDVSILESLQVKKLHVSDKLRFSTYSRKMAYLGEEGHASKGQDHEVKLSKQDLLSSWSPLLVPSPLVIPLLLSDIHLNSR